MGTGIRNIRQKRTFSVGSFNVRGLTEDTKKEQLMRDVNQYGIDVCALQETKIENAGVHRVNGSMITPFDSKNKHYGYGIVVPKKWQESIHKYWRESNRICVLQLSGNPDTCADRRQYECKPTRKCRIKISNIKMRPKNIINIINVYAPTSDRAKKCPNEIKKLYKNLDKLCQEFDKAPSSITILAGHFNSKARRKTGPESCIGQWPRGRRNQNGTNLVDICDITTWSQRRINLLTKQNVWLYNQIDYIILNQKKKQVLADARSYGGTETLLDHRLIVARIKLTWERIYHQRVPNTIQKRLDTRQLTQNEDNQKSYREQIKQETVRSGYIAVQQENKWEKLKEIIKCATETYIGYKNKVYNHQISDPDLERMQKEQNHVKRQIENRKDPEKNKQLRKSRKEVLKELNQKVRDAREKRAEQLLGKV